MLNVVNFWFTLPVFTSLGFNCLLLQNGELLAPHDN